MTTTDNTTATMKEYAETRLKEHMDELHNANQPLVEKQEERLAFEHHYIIYKEELIGKATELQDYNKEAAAELSSLVEQYEKKFLANEP
jgi:PHD/YefM family antitoxin component YafN of YafNO toxin-antitoxin module